MLEITCTKKLAERLPERLSRLGDDVPALDRWCVNIATVHRKQSIIAMNAESRLGILLWGVRKPQFARLPELVAAGIRGLLASYGVRREILDDYVTPKPGLWTGMSRADVARLNHIGIDMSLMRIDTMDDIPLDLAKWVNNMPVNLGSDDCFIPLERMLDLLEARYHMKPIARPAFELSVRFDLERYVATRTLIVPAEYTFAQLHHVLQRALGWQDYHLYLFNVDGRRIADPWDETGAELAHQTRLDRYLKAGSTFQYLYDFGDGWEMDIDVTAFLPDYDQPFPSCTACEGAAPPEDVGGVPGYLDFMDAYADPDHPEHETMREWVGHRWDQNPSARMIDFWLKD